MISGASKGTVTEMQDAEYSGKTSDTCEMAATCDDSVSDMAVDSSLSMLSAVNDVGAEMISSMSLPTAAVPDGCTNSVTEISASVPVSDNGAKSYARPLMIAVTVTDAQVEDIPVDKADVESDHNCQVIEPCEEMSSENSHKPVTLIRSISNSTEQTVDTTGDEGDNQLVLDSDITGRHECTQSVNVLHVPVGSSEMLASDVAGTRLSLPETSLDLSWSLADYVSGPHVDEFADHRKTDQQPMPQTSDQVNSELRDGNARMCAMVAVAY